MGLDMYLLKTKRYKNASPKVINTVSCYLYWEKNLKNDITMEDCLRNLIEFLPSEDVINYYRQNVDGEYGLFDEVGYWRKANSIHRWFVDKVQDGEDDCEYYEVSKEDLEELLNTCYTVLGQSEIITANIIAECGRNEHGEIIEKTIAKKIIKNPTAATSLLPTQNGFFFGDTDYNEWYINDLEKTIEIILNALKTTDFDKEMVVYHSSW